MTQLAFILIGAILGVALGAPAAIAEDEVAQYEYPGRFIITSPYPTVLATEQYRTKMVIENLGEESLTIIEDGWNDVVQIAWVPWGEAGIVASQGRNRVGSFVVSPAETMRDSNFDYASSLQLLDPGETYQSDEVLIEIGEKNIVSGGKHRFSPVFFGGKGRLIYGQPVEFNVIYKGVTSFTKVFEADFKSGLGSFPFGVYLVPIDGENYLFGSTGIRFCRIPPGVDYDITMDFPEGEHIMTVTFDDPKLEPLVYSWRQYRFISGSPETVPWLFLKDRADAGNDDETENEDESDPVINEARSAVQQDEQVAAFPRQEAEDERERLDDGSSWMAVVGIGGGLLFIGIVLFWKSKRNPGAAGKAD